VKIQTPSAHGRDDASLHLRLATNAVDDPDFSLGIVRLCPKLEVLYVNRAVRTMAGEEIQVGTNLSSLLLDDTSVRALHAALQQRFEEQRGSSYRIRFRRRDLDTLVCILVSAVPEYDAHGKLIGSIGFLIDESVEEITAAVHQTIAKATACDGLLNDLRNHLRNLIRFDSILITGVSHNRQHVRRIFEEPSAPKDTTPKMWWPMSAFLKAMIEDFEPGPQDLRQLLESEDFKEYARSDPSVQQFRDRGFRHALRFGVHQGAQLIAIVSLLRRDAESFTCADYARCIGIPISEAVTAALSFEHHRDLRFSVDFINHISAVAGNLQAVAQSLVDRLAEHYGWEHVSLFRIDREGTRLCMICQAANSSHRLPENYSQAVTKGLIGRAYQEQRVVKVGDVTSEVARNNYQQLTHETRSEMVLPVPGTQGRWLLNIESTLGDAFADDEQESVEVQLRIAGFILERMAALELTSAVVNSVADAVFQTNDLGVILEANPAAERLLGRKPAELQHRNLAVFIAPDTDEAPVEQGATSDNAWTVSDTVVPHDSPNATLVDAVRFAQPLPIKLVHADGTAIPVLMSGAYLPERLGGKVFVASDLRTRNQIQRLEVQRTVFNQIASEIRVPLALAATFLKDALEATEGAARELVDKTLRQIRKVETPTERMVRLVADGDKPLPRQTFDIQEALRKVVAELPCSDAEGILPPADEPPVLVNAPRHELLLCVRSLLAWLLRRKAHVEKVHITAERSRDDVLITLALYPSSVPTEAAQTEDPSRSELELVESMVKDLMRRMGATYSADGDPPRTFRLLVIPPRRLESVHPARHP
jgi:PAS domain-containing protein